MRLGFALSLVITAAIANAADPLATELASRAAVSAQALRGQADWFFVTKELAHYGSPAGWATAVPATPKASSPLDVIAACRDNLASAGIELVLVPVPGKVVLHAHQLLPPVAVPQGRLDSAERAFYDALEQRGVTVVDLTPIFAHLKDEPFCHQDSHYSPAGQQAAAAAVATLIKGRPWYAAQPKLKTSTFSATVAVTGDLAQLAGEPLPAKEQLVVRQVKIGEVFADDETLAAQRRASPIVLMGDSHCLVYGSGGDLLADHAAFGSQLTAETGLPVDVVANRGSGLNAPRIELIRRKDRLAGKTIVVWLFTARLFTQTTESWKVLDLIR